MSKLTKKLGKILDVILENDVKKDNQDSRVHVINETGSDMMCMSSVNVNGDNMEIVGSLMGAWESVMYVSPEDVVKMLGLVFKPATIGYMVRLPWMLYNRRKEEADK